jgi:hypothetical protein
MAPTKGSGFVFLLQSAHPSFIHASSISGTSASSDGYHSDDGYHSEWRQKMQKAHLFEALLMVNQGIDNAIQGLQRLKKKSDLLQEPFAETVARLESDRAQVNVRFFAVIEARQQRETEQLIRS